ncbi:MAG: hypothetical protein ACRCT1_04305 [Microcoleaceae cyanobacterium]
MKKEELINHKGTKAQRKKETSLPIPHSPLPITHYPLPNPHLLCDLNKFGSR